MIHVRKWLVEHPKHGELLIESYGSCTAIEIAQEVWETEHTGGMQCSIAKTRKQAEWTDVSLAT